MNSTFENRWIMYFRNNGYPDTTELAKGMEGAVYSLIPHKLIAKVWIDQSEKKLRRFATFYSHLAFHIHPVQTSELVNVIVVDNTTITIEKFLPGLPLESYISMDSQHIDDRAIHATIKILSILKNVPVKEEFGSLSIFGENCGMIDGKRKWSDVVQNVLDLQVKKYGKQLRFYIPDLDDVLLAINSFLITRDKVPMSIIHGDLCNANIMTNSNLQPLAVFDFCFMLPVGDPAFDASISSAIFNMYGQHARSIIHKVTRVVCDSLNIEIEVLLAYRAVYAIMTSNLYSPDGTDGHFKWCINMLHQKELRSVLGL